MGNHLFDRDTKLLITLNDKEIDIRDRDFVQISDHVFAFAIPVPHSRNESLQISIEHYFTDDEIKTEDNGKRLFMRNEFYEIGVFKGKEDYYYKGAKNIYDIIKIIEHETNTFVTRHDATGDCSISKSAFVKNISDSKEHFADFSFEEFKKYSILLEKLFLRRILIVTNRASI